MCLHSYQHNPWGASSNFKTNGNQIWRFMYSGLSHWESELLISNISKECTSCNFKRWQATKTTNELMRQTATHACAHIQHMLTWHSEPPGSLKDKPGTFLQNSRHQRPCYSVQQPRTPESSTSVLWNINQAPITNWSLLWYIGIGNGEGEWMRDIDTLPIARQDLTSLLHLTSQHAVHCL